MKKKMLFAMLFIAVLAMLFGCNDITRIGDSEIDAIDRQSAVLERLVSEIDSLNTTTEQVLYQMAYDNAERKSTK